MRAIFSMTAGNCSSAAIIVRCYAAPVAGSPAIFSPG
jgi:hypothetical protein